MFNLRLIIHPTRLIRQALAVYSASYQTKYQLNGQPAPSANKFVNWELSNMYLQLGQAKSTTLCKSVYLGLTFSFQIALDNK